MSLYQSDPFPQLGRQTFMVTTLVSTAHVLKIEPSLTVSSWLLPGMQPVEVFPLHCFIPPRVICREQTHGSLGSMKQAGLLSDLAF